MLADNFNIHVGEPEPKRMRQKASGMGAPGFPRKLDWAKMAIDKKDKLVQEFESAKTYQELPDEKKTRDHMGVLESKYTEFEGKVLSAADMEVRDQTFLGCAALVYVADHLGLYKKLHQQKEEDLEAQYEHIRKNPNIPDLIKNEVRPPRLIRVDLDGYIAEKRLEHRDLKGMRDILHQAQSEEDQESHIVRLFKKIVSADRGSFQNEFFDKKSDGLLDAFGFVDPSLDQHLQADSDDDVWCACADASDDGDQRTLKTLNRVQVMTLLHCLKPEFYGENSVRASLELFVREAPPLLRSMMVNAQPIISSARKWLDQADKQQRRRKDREAYKSKCFAIRDTMTDWAVQTERAVEGADKAGIDSKLKFCKSIFQALRDHAEAGEVHSVGDGDNFQEIEIQITEAQHKTNGHALIAVICNMRMVCNYHIRSLECDEVNQDPCQLVDSMKDHLVPVLSQLVGPGISCVGTWCEAVVEGSRSLQAMAQLAKDRFEPAQCIQPLNALRKASRTLHDACDAFGSLHVRLTEKSEVPAALDKTAEGDDIQRVLLAEHYGTMATNSAFEIFCRTVTVARSIPGQQQALQITLAEQAEKKFHDAIASMRPSASWEYIYGLQERAKPVFRETWHKWVEVAHLKLDPDTFAGTHTHAVASEKENSATIAAVMDWASESVEIGNALPVEIAGRITGRVVEAEREWDRAVQRVFDNMQGELSTLNEDFMSKLALKLCIYKCGDEEEATDLLGFVPGSKSFEDLVARPELDEAIARMVDAIANMSTLQEHPALLFAVGDWKMQMGIMQTLHAFTRSSCRAFVARWHADGPALIDAVLEMSHCKTQCSRLQTPQILQLLSDTKAKAINIVHPSAGKYLSSAHEMFKVGELHFQKHMQFIADDHYQQLEATQAKVTALFDQSFSEYEGQEGPQDRRHIEVCPGAHACGGKFLGGMMRAFWSLGLCMVFVGKDGANPQWAVVHDMHHRGGPCGETATRHSAKSA